MVRTLQWAWRVVSVRTYAGGLYTGVLGEMKYEKESPNYKNCIDYVGRVARNLCHRVVYADQSFYEGIF